MKAKCKSIIAICTVALMLTGVIPPLAIAQEHDTGPVTYPIPGWKDGGGSPWLTTGYNASNGAYNPYSKGPNTSHILWIDQAEFGGVVGGEEAKSYSAHSAFRVFVVLMGRVYYVTGQWRADRADNEPIAGGATIHCVDENTGEEIFASLLPGNASNIRTMVAVPDTSETTYTRGVTLYAGGYGGVFGVDAWSGATMWSWLPPGKISPAVSTYYDHKIYVTDHMAGGIFNCYNVGDQARYITPAYWVPVWEKTEGFRDIQSGIGVSANLGMNLTTGEIIWSNEGFQGSGFTGSGYGKEFVGGLDGYMYAFDALTGQQLWKSDQKGGIWGYGGAIAYNKVYQGSYDGIFYAFDANNGQVVWTFNLNDYNAQQGLSVPDVYASNGWGWPWQCQPVAADGKVYAVSEQHSPNQPRVAGHHLFAFDAETGDILWTFPASGASNSNPIVADDLLFVSNTYTNQLMCFGKGPTAIELSVPQARIETGDYTWINGRITDQSPAQKDTPAVSKESMDAWMAYLNGGESMPTTVTGVPVKLTAVSSSGQVIDIGTVTSDSNGYFQSKWTPPSEDAYTIKADFAGDDSYWSSTQRTDLAVGKATVSQQTSQSTTQDYTLLFDALIAGVAVAIIVGVVNIAALRKLKK